jgi:lipoate-protein ligase A
MVSKNQLIKEWRLLDLSYPSAYRNLALEEALARSMRSTHLPTVRFWTNQKAVILGRFQEVEGEVDTALCEENDIEVTRRFTGGGAVYHDNGNLNLTIATPRRSGLSLNAIYCTNRAVVSNMLEQLGVKTGCVLPNSLEISGKKISGAAVALGKDYSFWHASILISTDTEMLERVLLPGQTRRSTRFVRSKWQPVMTLENALGIHVGMEQVKRELSRSVERSLGVTLEAGQLCTDEANLVESLLVSKYSTREWNFQGLTS